MCMLVIMSTDLANSKAKIQNVLVMGVYIGCTFLDIFKEKVINPERKLALCFIKHKIHLKKYYNHEKKKR